ncbi:hypothetical protein D0C28_27010 [Rhizobium sp. AU243]|nr:hypothetical protein D0C28_27010 [Rhizobium sp. AU243]
MGPRSRSYSASDAIKLDRNLEIYNISLDRPLGLGLANKDIGLASPKLTQTTPRGMGRLGPFDLLQMRAKAVTISADGGSPSFRMRWRNDVRSIYIVDFH